MQTSSMQDEYYLPPASQNKHGRKVKGVGAFHDQPNPYRFCLLLEPNSIDKQSLFVHTYLMNQLLDEYKRTPISILIFNL